MTDVHLSRFRTSALDSALWQREIGSDVCEDYRLVDTQYRS